MSERQPWWYSGDEAGEEDETRAEDSSSSSVPALDWMALLSGAQKVVDWATDRVLAPHSEHGDPHDHPDCMVCRTLVMAGRFDVPMPWSSSAQSPATSETVGETGVADSRRDDEPSDDAIHWIPIVADPTGPQP